MPIWNILWPFGIFYGHLEYFMAIWNILWPFGIFYRHLGYFMTIWYIFCGSGIMHQEKKLATMVCTFESVSSKQTFRVSE
jgi:hypothetical protein